jgi:hypothetical protein
MAADLEAIIADAVSDASGSTGSDEAVDTSGDVVADVVQPDTSVDTPEVDTSKDDVDTDDTKVEADAVKEEKPADDSVEGILAAAGIKAPKEGERENRIPYNRTVKIIGNALKKQGATHTAAVAELNTKVAAQEGELTNFRRADSLATSDPDKYMAILATINPAFKAYTKAGAAAAAEKPAAGAPASKLGAKPGPDIKYADGSLAFSPEQLEKREEWLIANAVEKATADAEARAEAKYGPLAKEFATTTAGREQHQRIMGVIQAEQEHWGEDFPKPGSAEEKAVDGLLKADPKLSLRGAIHKVVVGGLKAGKAQVRESLLTEINGRKGASAAAPAAKKVAADPSVVRSTEEIIRESIAAAGLK